MKKRIKALLKRLKPLSWSLVKHTAKDVKLTLHLLWWSFGYHWEWLDFDKKGRWTKIQYFHLIILTVRTTQGYRTKEYLEKVEQNEQNMNRRAARMKLVKP